MRDQNLSIKFKYRLIKRKFLQRLGFLQLTNIFISPSHECNANCIHCYEKFQSKNESTLNTEEVKNCIDQFYKLGGILVYFCSGEFLMRKDAIELIRYTRQKNLLVSVTSNGILLDKKKIDELKEAGLNHLIVSIDSADANIHDQFRNVAGCFEKAKNALQYARLKGIRTQIWTYVTKTNFNELEGISKLVTELKTEPAFVFFPLLSGHLFNKFDENLSFEERELFRQKFNTDPNILLEFPSEQTLCRGGGLQHINIMPSGDVTFCPPVPYSYGNIKEQPLRNILKKIKKDYFLFQDKACRGQCPVNSIEYRNNCNARLIYETSK